VLVRLVAALLAGLLLSLAFEPVAVVWVAPLSVAALVLVLRGVRARRGLLLGLVFGAAFYLTHIWWMRAVALAAWLGLSALETAFYGLFGAVAAVLLRHRWWPLWVPAAWVVIEVWRSYWPFSGMPWGRLAFSTVDSPWAQPLPYVGMVGVSALLAATGTLLAWLALAVRAADLRAARGPVAGLAAVAACVGLSVVAPYDPGEAEREVTVAAVQGDVPGPGNDVLFDFRQVTANHVDATVALGEQVAAGEVEQPAFVVWPENSTAVDPFADTETRTGIQRAAEAVGAPVLVGGLVDDGEDYVLNQGVVWDPATGPGDRYTKWHPVPYGEYIPFRQYADFTFGELARIRRDMRAGTRTEPLRVGGVQVADAICFDVAYDDGLRAQVRSGAQMLAVQTSNATFIFTDQVEQQFAITRLRALEHGKWLVVASTNGLSGILDPRGEVVVGADKRTTDTMVATVGLHSGTSPGVLLSPWVTRLALLVSLVGLVLAWPAYRRSRRVHHDEPGEGSVTEQDSRRDDRTEAEA